MEMETRRIAHNLTESTINDFNGRICATLIEVNCHIEYRIVFINVKLENTMNKRI